jgi:hypothetical protein
MNIYIQTHLLMGHLQYLIILGAVRSKNFSEHVFSFGNFDYKPEPNNTHYTALQMNTVIQFRESMSHLH